MLERSVGRDARAASGGKARPQRGGGPNQSAGLLRAMTRSAKMQTDSRRVDHRRTLSQIASARGSRRSHAGPSLTSNGRGLRPTQWHEGGCQLSMLAYSNVFTFAPAGFGSGNVFAVR